MRSLVLCSVLTSVGLSGMLMPVAPLVAAPAAVVAVNRVGQDNGTGLTASYFPNGTLAGRPALRRIDNSLDFRWGNNAPGPGLPADYFSIRWEGLVLAPSTGSYRFVANAVGEVRLWVNGKKILDTWNGRKADPNEGYIDLAAGEKTTFKLEYGAGEGEARLQMQWVVPGRAAQPIPTSNLFPLGSSLVPVGDEPAATAAAPAPAPAPAVAAKPAPKEPVKPKPREAKPAEPAVAQAPKPAAKPEPKPEPKPQPKPEPKPEPKKEVAKAPKTAEPKTKPEPAKAAPAIVDAPAEITPGVYILRSRTTGQALEVYDPSRPNNLAFQVPGTKAPVQELPQWRIENMNNGYYRLVVPSTNRVLEVLGSSTSNGAVLNLWPYYSGNNQVWRIEPTKEGYYKLLAKHSNKALTARDSTAEGVKQWRYRNDLNQDWKLEKVVPKQPALMNAGVVQPGIGTNRLSLYPNPSNGIVQLTYQLPADVPVGWVLYSQRGGAVRVSDYRRREAGVHNQTLEFTDLPPGDYYLNLTVGSTTTKHALLLRSPNAADAAPGPSAE